MRTIGCLTVLAILCVGIWLLAGSQDMSDRQKAQWVGQKAHRGWNQAKQMAAEARGGWQSEPDRVPEGRAR